MIQGSSSNGEASALAPRRNLSAFGIGFGVAFAWTGSLMPSVVAHAIINFPMTPLWQGVVLTAFVIGAAVTGRRGVAIVKQVFSTAMIILRDNVEQCHLFGAAHVAQPGKSGGRRSHCAYARLPGSE